MASLPANDFGSLAHRLLKTDGRHNFSWRLVDAVSLPDPVLETELQRVYPDLIGWARTWPLKPAPRLRSGGCGKASSSCRALGGAAATQEKERAQSETANHGFRFFRVLTPNLQINVMLKEQKLKSTKIFATCGNDRIDGDMCVVNGPFVDSNIIRSASDPFFPERIVFRTFHGTTEG